jgi:hypothetical protein
MRERACSKSVSLGNAVDRTLNAVATTVDTSGGEAPAPQIWTENRGVCGQPMVGKENETTHPSARR